MSLLEGSSVPTGDIWSTGAFSFESPLKDLLDSGSYTLEQLLSEDELLQELRGMHPQLVDFFSQEEAVIGLVKYISIPPPTSLKYKDRAIQQNDSGSTQMPCKDDREEDSLRYIRFPYMACEIICCEINGIIDTLLECRTGSCPRTRPLLDMLFSILYSTPPGMLDDHRAGYLDKILAVLFRKRPTIMSLYIDEGGGKGGFTLMKALFSHIYSHSIMQIVQRLLLPPSSATIETSDKQDMEALNGRRECDQPPDAIESESTDDNGTLFRCNWSKSSEAIELLLGSLVGTECPSLDSEEIEERRLYESQNASEVLITVIQNSPLSSATLLRLTTDPMLERIVKSAAIINNGMNFGRHDSRLTCAMNVLESLVLQLGGYGTAAAMVDSDDNLTFQKSDGELSDNDADSPLSSREADLASPQTLSDHLPRLLESLSDLLRHPLASLWVSPVQYSLSVPQQLLGTSRLRVVRLLESLVLLGNRNIDGVLCQSDCLEVCLDLFWMFEWCSMLHQSVANLLVHVFEGADLRSGLQAYFLIRCNLLNRLMDSFLETGGNTVNDGFTPGIAKMRNGVKSSSNGSLSEAIMAMKSHHNEQPTSSVESEQGSVEGSSVSSASVSDPDRIILPVSCDDVDVALEQQDAVVASSESQNLQKERESTAMEIKGDARFSDSVTTRQVPSSLEESFVHSFRIGYMGHVIIICQALVHACSDNNELNKDADVKGTTEVGAATELGEARPEMNGKHETSCTDLLSEKTTLPAGADLAGTVGRQGGVADRRIIAQILQSHPLRLRWQEFVRTTLASEFAVQSAPLGGFNASVGNVDPLHAHRPSVIDGGDFGSHERGELSAAARGLLVGGDVIDMDDNDLDIAASMMEALTLPPKGVEAVGDAARCPSSRSNDSDKGSATGFGTVIQNANVSSGTYIYDDPLGRVPIRFNYGDSTDETNERRGVGGDDHSGINKELTAFGVAEPSPFKVGKDDVETDNEEDEVPVIDLFAGNFSFGMEPGCAADTDASGWTNFANFDDAFTTPSDCESTTSRNTSGNRTVSSEEVDMSANDSSLGGVDDIFDSSPHALLLTHETTCTNNDIENRSHCSNKSSVVGDVACERVPDQDHASGIEN